jgi:tripartite-type tricarboxylate transporter receptor subunit TctC
MQLKRILFAGILLAPLVALAQAYPTKPVRIMVGANAGGGTDIIARMLAEKMADGLKGSFVVENKPGPHQVQRGLRQPARTEGRAHGCGASRREHGRSDHQRSEGIIR